MLLLPRFLKIPPLFSELRWGESFQLMAFQTEKQSVLNPSQYWHHALRSSGHSDLKYWPSPS